jgi:hypothetical protein
MPKSKKAAPKKSTKKATKPAPKKKAVAASSRRTAAPKAVHPLHQSFLHKEQEDFHRAHPNANALIATFIVAFGLLVVLYVGMM